MLATLCDTSLWRTLINPRQSCFFSVRICLILGSPQRRTCRGSGFAVRAGLPGSEKQDAEDQANAAEEERIERLEKLTRQKRRKPQPPQLRQRRVDAVR